MTNSSPWKDPPIFKFGKPSMNGPFPMAMLNNQSIYILYYIYYIIYIILYILYYILYIIHYILYIIYYKYIHSYSIWATSEVSFWLPRPPSSTPAMWPSSLVPPLDDFGDFYSNVYWFLWIFMDFYWFNGFFSGCLWLFIDVYGCFYVFFNGCLWIYDGKYVWCHIFWIIYDGNGWL